MDYIRVELRGNWLIACERSLKAWHVRQHMEERSQSNVKRPCIGAYSRLFSGEVVFTMILFSTTWYTRELGISIRNPLNVREMLGNYCIIYSIQLNVSF